MKTIEPKRRLDNCQACKELSKYKTIHRCIWGRGAPGKIMLVGQNPGAKEDIEGRPFVGPSGKLLQSILKEIGEDNFYITNVVKCFYPKDPTESMVENCIPYLIHEILETKPVVIITLGKIAMKALTGKSNIEAHSFTPLKSPIKEIRNIPILCTYHPSYSLRKGHDQTVKGHIYQTILTALSMIKHFNGTTTEYVVANDPSQLNVLRNFKTLAIDIETNMINEFDPNAKIKSISFCYQTGKAIVVPLEHDWWGEKYEEILNFIRELFLDKDRIWIGHNIKFDLRWLKKHLGIEITHLNIEDTILMHHLLAPHERHGLNTIALKYTSLGTYDEKVKEIGGPEKATGPILWEYNAKDSDACYRIFLILKKELERYEMYNMPYRALLIEAQKVFTEIEHRGIPSDKGFLINAYAKLKKRAMEIRQLITENEIVREIFRNETFNPFSYQHMDRLVKTLNIDFSDAPKTAKGNISYGKVFLKKYEAEHELLNLIARLRTINSLCSHIERQYIPAIMPDGRIHPTFDLFTARSGRTSSKNPNLQNLKKEEIEGIKLRNFIYSPPGWRLISADYSQHELRVAAALSRDKRLIEVLNNDIDIHSLVASRIYKIPYEEFIKRKETDEEIARLRRNAKQCTFGIIYGITAQGLANNLNIPLDEAKKMIASFFEEFPTLHQWITDLINFTRDAQYVTTPFRRRRMLHFEDHVTQKAINTPIQSAASDLMLSALIALHKTFKQKKMQSHILLEVHDEILFLVKEEETEEAKHLITQISQKPPFSNWLGDVQLKIELTESTRWGEK